LKAKIYLTEATTANNVVKMKVVFIANNYKPKHIT